MSRLGRSAFLLLSFQALLSSVVFADPMGSTSASCGGDNIQCGSERVDDKSDNRQPPGPVVQPAAPGSVIGSCGTPLPPNQSYGASLRGITCGSGGDSRPRKPMVIPDEILDKVAALQASGKGKAALEDMQAARRLPEVLTGTVDYPVTESWTYQVLVAGFDAGHCGTEPVQMLCSRPRTQTLYRTEYRNDGECDSWGEDPPPSTTVNPNKAPLSPRSKSRSGSPTQSTTSPKQPYVAPPSYKGESSSDIRGRMDKMMRSGSSPSSRPSNSSRPSSSSRSRRSDAEKKDSSDVGMIEESAPLREPARVCLHRASVPHQIAYTVDLAPFVYPCVVPRARYCSWPETRTASRACPKQTVNYTVNYSFDPKWKPGYKDPTGNQARDYSAMIPNKFDLLLGEREDRRVLVNSSGASSSVNVQLKINSKWNEYKVAPLTLACQFGKTTEAKLDVQTVGRLKARAPKLLELPSDGSALKFDRGRPSEINLIDGARNQAMDASEISRAFPDQQTVDPEFFKAHPNEVNEVSAKGWWVDTRFKIQLFRRDNWNRMVTVTLPNTPDSNQVNYYMDQMRIDLEGRGAMERFYRPSAPLAFILGSVYKKYGIELTPGQKYWIRVQMVNRGLPFYESGCTGGKNVCEGQEATNDSLSEPIDVPFVADPNVDNRSWFKKFIDWQEHRKIF